MHKEYLLNEYLDDLASKSAAPGGGAAAAITGAQGAALLSMVCNLTIGKEKFKDNEREVKKILIITEAKRKEMVDLAIKDKEAFEKVMLALKIPKNDSGDNENRHYSIQSSLKEAAMVPLSLMKICSHIYPYVNRLRHIGNSNVLSDVLIAGYLLDACFISAKINVEVNLDCITDKDFCIKIKNDIETILIKI